ncbi:hypothetical protein KJ969_04655 [Patescibacteria group bacterium]|nr:hypothetical protein [Patescibacteria group bacterium]MBU1922305.1 hypothetical protein [Patescibacteria group bacterium]
MRKRLNTRYGWASLNVEELGSSRLYAILPRQRAARNKAEKDFRKKFPDGAILISRRDPQNPDRRKYQIHAHGIFSAIRGRSRIRFKYGNEWHGGEVRDVTLNINSARLYLEMLLNYCRLSPRRQFDIQACLEQLAQSLERKRNLFKAEAHDFIELSSEPEDSLGRVNPSVMCNQLATGMKNLIFRLLEMPGISEFINRDQVHLIAARDQHLTLCKMLDYRFCQALERPLMKAPHEYTSEPMPRLLQWLRCNIAEFQNITVAPFTKTRYHALRDLAQAYDFARARDYAAAKARLLVVRNSLRFKEAQFHLEEIILKVTLILDELDVDKSKRNMDWSIGRSSDLGANIGDLRERLHKILDDRGFSFRPMNRLFAHLGEAEEYLYTLKLEAAKDELKKASNLI